MAEQKEMQFNTDGIITRNPRLETIEMVEKFIKEYSGDYKKTELFHRMPKKIMWGTFNVILEYLWENNKIGIDRKGYVVYVWNPALVEKLKNRKSY